MSEVPVFFQGEARLIRWSESANAGRTVTLEIEEIGERHPFKGLRYGASNGQRMAVVFILIGDDEKPQQNAVGAQRSASNGPDQTDSPHCEAPYADLKDRDKDRKRFRELPRSQQAALKCQDDDFIDWMCATYPDDTYGSLDSSLKRILNVVSKKELDTNPEKGAAWDALLTDYDYRNVTR